ncbi:metallophosphoesterase [Metabacillus sp. GX 13764]|uniref:DNA repair exonuclease n=1 Tax=Metabacillus kandeliae TaxID=2900151 RepID=UPI001E4F3667|nr:DNA repair exonuclease [Metabacillus kandeliae]MCD7034846.1 metallophosphoesterase [Metabacillus kandeliae]
MEESDEKVGMFMQHIKFLHAADLHLDSPFKGLSQLPASVFQRLKNSTFEAFSNLAELAIKEQVDFVLLAGDLYDGEDRSLKAQLKIRNECLKMKEHGIQVYMIHGNHDHLSGAWIEMEWPDNVYIFPGEETVSVSFVKNGVHAAQIYGRSYPERAVLANIAQDYSKTADAGYHIAMLHGSAEGAPDHDPYAPFQLKELLDKDFDYWALGHIHKRQVLNHEPPVIYPGNIQGRSRKETGEKGCYLVELSENGPEYAFYPLNDVIWKKQSIQMEGISSFDALLEECLALVEAARREKEAVCLFIGLAGISHLADELEERQALQELRDNLNEFEAEEQSFVWIGGIENETLPAAGKDELKRDSVFFRDLLQVMESYEDEAAAVNGLFQNPLIRKHLDPFTESELLEIKEEAEKRVLKSLLKEGVRK